MRQADNWICQIRPELRPRFANRKPITALQRKADSRCAMNQVRLQRLLETSSWPLPDTCFPILDRFNSRSGRRMAAQPFGTALGSACQPFKFPQEADLRSGSNARLDQQAGCVPVGCEFT